MSISTLWSRATRWARWHRRGLSAACAALAVLLAVRAATPSRPPTVPVVVAAHEIAPGTRLQTRDLVVRGFPADLSPEGAVHDAATAAGHTVSAALAPGTPVTERSFSSTGSLAGPGQQLVGFHIPDASVLALVHVGDLVSVVTTTQASSATVSPSDAVVTLATRVRVAALPQAGGGGGMISSGDANGALVVVSCDPKTAATLAAWASSSQLGITLG